MAFVPFAPKLANLSISVNLYFYKLLNKILRKESVYSNLIISQSIH